MSGNRTRPDPPSTSPSLTLSWESAVPFTNKGWTAESVLQSIPHHRLSHHRLLFSVSQASGSVLYIIHRHRSSISSNATIEEIQQINYAFRSNMQLLLAFMKQTIYTTVGTRFADWILLHPPPMSVPFPSLI
jgi:hypothetical protein